MTGNHLQANITPHTNLLRPIHLRKLEPTIVFYYRNASATHVNWDFVLVPLL
jgi:hypothetical protein